ncbi:hypothetical protein L3Q82_014232 [Scortum barcoo]|uniref:Uncharacterized protein n=1 Tax=Scortum barcoo TaxID=214431 RepID=A0ACB8VWQ4_9TELE|nr:hypothetical protein L3Q82_014232 [Scortum barcoo]
MTRHRTTHTGERPYACHICGMRYRFAPNLKHTALCSIHTDHCSLHISAQTPPPPPPPPAAESTGAAPQTCHIQNPPRWTIAC